MIGNAYAYVQPRARPPSPTRRRAGFVTLTAEQIKAVALAVGAHVQACFAAEDAVDAAIPREPAHDRLARAGSMRPSRA